MPAELISRAGIAFQATEPDFDIRYAVRGTNGELKALYFNDGQQAAALMHSTREQTLGRSFCCSCLAAAIYALCRRV